MQNKNQVIDKKLQSLNTAINKFKALANNAKEINNKLKEIGGIVGDNNKYNTTPNYRAKAEFRSFQEFLDIYVNKTVRFTKEIQQTIKDDLEKAYKAFEQQHLKINTTQDKIQPQDIVQTKVEQNIDESANDLDVKYTIQARIEPQDTFKQYIDPKTTSNIAATSPIQKSTVKTGSKDDFDVKQNFSHEPIELIELINKELDISLLKAQKGPEEAAHKKKDVIINAYNQAYGYNISPGDEDLKKRFFNEMAKTFQNVEKTSCDLAFDVMRSHCYGQQMTDDDFDALKQEKIDCTSRLQDNMVKCTNFIFGTTYRSNEDNNKRFKDFREHVKNKKTSLLPIF